MCDCSASADCEKCSFGRSEQSGVAELFEKINETVQQGKVKKPEMKNHNVKDSRKVIQTKFEMKNVHNFSLVQTMEEKTKPETIVGQLTPSGNNSFTFIFVTLQDN